MVGLRTTTGRIAAFNSSAKDERIISNPLMSVQGPLTRDPSVAVRQNLRDSMAASVAPDRDGSLSELQRQQAISRARSLFLPRYPVLLMPVCWQRQFAIDEDTHDAPPMQRLMRAQSQLLGTAMMGLPGLSAPTGLSGGLPTGVQRVSARFRKDVVLRVGQLIAAAAGFSALAHLSPQAAPGH